jgi:hypothetical protein
MREAKPTRRGGTSIVADEQTLLGLETGTRAPMNGFWMIRFESFSLCFPVLKLMEGYFNKLFNPHDRRFRVHASWGRWMI